MTADRIDVLAVLDTEIDAALPRLTALAEARAAVAELIGAAEQIAVLAEYGTTGPTTAPPCKSGALTAAEATSLRGAISTIARAALARVKGEQA